MGTAETSLTLEPWSDQRDLASPCRRAKGDFVHLPLTNHFFTFSPHCSGPLLLSAVCDGLNSTCISEMWIPYCKVWRPTYWTAEAMGIVSAASFAGGLCSYPLVRVIPVGTGMKQQLLSYRYQERKSAAWLQLGIWGMKHCIPVTPINGLLKCQISLNCVPLLPMPPIAEACRSNWGPSW